MIAVVEILIAQLKLARRLLREGRKADARIALVGAILTSQRVDEAREEAKRELAMMIVRATRSKGTTR